ncbi:MAG TPA: polysaccharide deacetylase family protein [Solirubrobacteraceae bacterium]|nr:polysaccharide deacetylase family protein [Solirubrobacteraceae bacterium]
MSSLRSVFAKGARRWELATSSLSAAHVRTAREVVALLGFVATVALLAVALSGGGGDAGALGAQGPSEGSAQGLLHPIAGPPATRPSTTLYRIVGCRSHGDVIYRGGPARREVAIGFDDGPETDTPAFVEMLARNHAQATFFMIGRQITASFRDTMLRELREGDVLGDHTYTHPDLTRSRDVRGELEKTLVAIRQQSGYTPCVFRPPYGAVNAQVVRTARSLGLATVGWNVDPSDYTQPGTATIVRRVLEQVRPGSIIISHDGGGPRGQTLAAYPKIIAALRRRGYGVVTIPQLLGFRPVYEPCVRLCDGIGVPRSRLPHNALLQNAPA